jgi:hypothetical protein
MKKLSNFKVGDKVWIERTEFVETVDMIRNPQVIESIIDVPLTHNGERVILQDITIKGSGFIYTGEDLKLYEGE